jgi:hypothetical protein
MAALKALVDDGLTAGCVLANLHHRRIIPLMERSLRIYEMHEDADPIALVESRLLPGLFPREYAATRARRAIDLRTGRNDDVALWAFTMLPVGLLVSGLPPSLARPVRGISGLRTPRSLTRLRPDLEHTRAQRSGGNKSGRRARGSGASGDGSAENGGVRSSGCASSRGSPLLGPRNTRRQAGRRRRATGGRAPPERWEPSPPSPRAAEAAEEMTPGAGVGAPAARQPTKEATSAAEAPARAADMAGTAAAATTCAEPPRKRKWGFSTVR